MPAGSRTVRRAALVALGSAFVATFAFAAPACAHVTVSPTEAVQGSFARVAFRVPTESDSASTIKVEVRLPDDAPVSSVSTAPVPGWTVTAQRRTLAKPVDVGGAQVTEVVSVLTWTATGDGAIKPGEFQEFPVSLGPLPKADVMVFKTLQTYSDGTIVRWIEEPGWSGTEPENPAPILRLTPGTGSANSAHGGHSDTASPGSGGASLGLGIAGLVAGLGGLALGGIAYLRTRRPTPAS